MKTYSAATLAALRSGENIVSAAVWIGAGTGHAYWGGYGLLPLAGLEFAGVGARGMVSAGSGALGGMEQGAEIVLSGVDPDGIDPAELASLRGAPAIIWSLVFDGSGSNLLQASVFQRGRVDRAPLVEAPGGESVIRIGVEGAARGQGRRSQRMRTDADQRLIDPDDTAFSRVSYAGEKVIYFGGRPPQTAGAALGGVMPGDLLTPDARIEAL